MMPLVRNLVTASPQLLVYDSFIRANSADPIGTAETGQTWTALTGTWGISANQAYNPSATTGALAVVESGANDVRITATIAAYAGQQGIALRVMDANNYIRCLRAGSDLVVQSVTAGTPSTVKTINGLAYANGDTWTVEARGNLIALYLNGVLKDVVVETGFLTATRHGLGFGLSNAGAKFGPFKIELL